MSEQQDTPPAVAADMAAQPQPTMYFSVSPLKLLVMATCSFGIYQVYWYYRQWGYVRAREKSDILPFARAIFSFLFCYSLFERIEVKGKSLGIAKSIVPGPLAAGWIVFSILARLPDPFWLISFFAVLFLVPVQQAANEINQVTNPSHDRNDKFSKWNLAGVVVGGLLFALTVLGTFLPPS